MRTYSSRSKPRARDGMVQRWNGPAFDAHEVKKKMSEGTESSSRQSTDDIQVSRSLSVVIAVGALVALAVVILVAMAVVQAFATRATHPDKQPAGPNGTTASLPGSANHSHVAPGTIISTATSLGRFYRRWTTWNTLK
ncbi:hypothetical protein HPB50_025725 [Hyalomma asiaticum]|uniref:Uncharacterized protein n=1 Tax=Hyalomma asiaticum TaxID=266040 RepID=A0ACB7RQX5_HYAAI|nr:hypothetical protein HPB50_025725 [Hyalomma asiaticum]